MTVTSHRNTHRIRDLVFGEFCTALNSLHGFFPLAVAFSFSSQTNPLIPNRVNKVRMERKKYDRDGASSLNDTRIAHLSSLGFNWGENKGDRKWEEHFRALQEYKAVHGDCRVPTKYAENTALGRWVSTRTCFESFVVYL